MSVDTRLRLHRQLHIASGTPFSYGSEIRILKQEESQKLRLHECVMRLRLDLATLDNQRNVDNRERLKCS
jgi:hypothetical protein